VKQSAILGHHKAAEIFLNYSIDSGLKRAAWGHERAGTMGVSCRQGSAWKYSVPGIISLNFSFCSVSHVRFFLRKNYPIAETAG
jgi:hypothetical protein